jgi:hypothetical protein
MYEMLYKGKPILVYDPYKAIKEGLVFRKSQITLYKKDDDETLVNLELRSNIQYRVLLEYLEKGWKILII